MLKNDETTLGTGQAIRLGARVLSISWSLCWIIFGFASGIGEGFGPGGVAARTALPGLVLLLTAFLAWRFEGLGGVLILIEGLVVTVYFWGQLNGVSAVGAFFILVYTTLPALAVGALFITSWRRGKMLQAGKGAVLPANSVTAS